LDGALMDKYKVVITDHEYETVDQEREILKRIGAAVYDYQLRDTEEIIKVAQDCDGLIVQFAQVPEKLIAALPRLKVIARYATGVDGIDLAAASKRGIVVANVPDYCSEEVALHTLTLLLELNRRIQDFSQWTRQGNWYGSGIEVRSMKDAAVGIIGFGRITKKLIAKLRPNCDHIWVHSEHAQAEEIAALGAEKKSFDEICRGADYISIHCPLNASTEGLFDQDVFRKMKPSAAIVNMARGAVIKEPDLVQALQNGQIAGAALDVLCEEPPGRNHPLIDMENVIVTPHTAWYSTESQRRLQAATAENVAAVLSGKAPKYCVNPEVLERARLKL
jgi:D-3-phosphoglycerate dehydrogenase